MVVHDFLKWTGFLLPETPGAVVAGFGRLLDYKDRLIVEKRMPHHAMQQAEPGTAGPGDDIIKMVGQSIKVSRNNVFGSGPGRFLLQLFFPLHLIPVFLCNQQHAKAFAFFFFQVFVVHFMRPADGFYITVITAGKPFKTLVNDYIMHQEIGKAVHRNACADTHHPPCLIHAAQHNAEPAGYGEYEKEGIILFKESLSGLMVVFMQVP